MEGHIDDRDPMTYIFGSNENWMRFMDLFMEGMVEEAIEPRPGDLVLYIDADDNVIFVGRVVWGRLIPDAEKTLVVQYKELGEEPGLTALDVPPVADVVRTLLVLPPD